MVILVGAIQLVQEKVLILHVLEETWPVLLSVIAMLDTNSFHHFFHAILSAETGKLYLQKIVTMETLEDAIQTALVIILQISLVLEAAQPQLQFALARQDMD